MNLSTVFAKMAMLILIMLLGYLCARIGITGPEFNKRVTPLMVTVLLPATILNSVLGAPAFQAIEIVDYILVLTVMVALQMLPAWLLPRLLRTRGEDAGAMRLTTAFGNVGFVGLPVVAAIFGEEMVFFASLCNIPFNLALYSSSASQLSPEGGRVRWQDVLNAPVIATLLSIVLLLTRVPVPGVIADTISAVSGVTIPLSMIVIGTSLGAISVRAALTDWRAYAVAAVRLLVCPLLTIGGSSKDGKRTALIHLYFNIIGSVVLLAAIYAVRYTIGIPVWGDVMNKSSIANIHTMSSVAAMLLFLPFSSVLSKLAVLTVPDSAEEAQELSMPVLDERLFKSPAVALQQAKNAVVKMSRRAARNVNLSAPLLLKMDEDVVSAVNVRENLIDRMEVEISNYLIKMTDQELGDDESHAVTELLNFVTEYERIGDYAVNIMEKSEELYEKEASFSDHAQEELKLLTGAMERVLDLTNDAFENNDVALARQVEPLEEVIDIMVEKLRDQHIKRLKNGICSIDTGVVFLDVLNNVERISDHCSNIAARLIGMNQGDDYDSHTLKSLMHHNPTKEYSLHYEQCCKDYLVPLEAMEA